MEKRINIHATEPQAYKAMLGLEGYLAQSEISKTIKELIKIRASQINGCAYCLDMHTKDAIKYGETAERIFLVSAWHEADKFFTEEEKVALKMTEEITLISQNGLSDETYQKAKSIFSEKQIAEIIMAIVTINSWNRIALSTKLEIGEF
ncbi:carboxymuconolactone decarboxylase family protein [Epilithonimonas caeni]|uniref:carboxymuconolactone decarboxylase family protein n=1 Tax=Epilithonimonas caeni TaxID=365343 RepID=UPI00042717BB|nr:carboxymuconolactone decarboxylase family protein [Epilithonimonas caeni]